MEHVRFINSLTHKAMSHWRVYTTAASVLPSVDI